LSLDPSDTAVRFAAKAQPLRIERAEDQVRRIGRIVTGRE
jgi:hypothetical protein